MNYIFELLQAIFPLRKKNTDDQCLDFYVGQKVTAPYGVQGVIVDFIRLDKNELNTIVVVKPDVPTPKSAYGTYKDRLFFSIKDIQPRYYV